MNESKHTAGVRYDSKTGQYFPTLNGIDQSPSSFSRERSVELAEQMADIANANVDTAKHSVGPWTIWQHVDGDRSVKQIGQKLPDGRLGEMVAANVPTQYAALIASAPSLLAENARLREALKRLLSAYEADVRAGIGIQQSWETNGQAIDQALTALAEGGVR